MTLNTYPIETARYMEIRCRIVQEASDGRPFVVGIDGPDGAGKSSLASYLSWQLNIAAIGLDLFLVPDQEEIVHDTKLLSQVLSKRLEQNRVTIVEGVKLLEVLAKQQRQPDFLIYVERTDHCGSTKLNNELQAYRDCWRPKDNADEVLEWSLNDTLPLPTSPSTALGSISSPS